MICMLPAFRAELGDDLMGYLWHTMLSSFFEMLAHFPAKGGEWLLGTATNVVTAINFAGVDG